MYSRLKNKPKRRKNVEFNRKSILKAIASFSVVLMLLTLITTGASAASTISDHTACDQNNCNSECEQANCDGTCCDAKPVAMEHMPNDNGDFDRERFRDGTCNLPNIQGNYNFDCLQRRGRDQPCLTNA